MDKAAGMDPLRTDLSMGLQRLEPEPVTRPVGPQVERSREHAPKALPMSAPVKRFNQILQRGLGQTSSTKQLLGRSLSPRKTLNDALKGRYGSGCVRRVAKEKGRDIYETIDEHRGPVIIMGVTGGPEFVFERLEDGSWQGYEANSHQPLPAGVGPRDKVAEQYNRHHGLMYSLYAVDGWEGGSRLTSSSEALVMQPHKDGGSEDWPVPETRHRRAGDDDDSGAYMTPPNLGPQGGTHRLRKVPRFDAALVDGDEATHGHPRAHGDDSDHDAPGIGFDRVSSSSSSVSSFHLGHEHEQEMDREIEQEQEMDHVMDQLVSPIEPSSTSL